MATHTIIIDDDPIVVIMLKKLIEITNFHAAPISFENGLQGLNHLKNNYNQDDTFSIFLDINMPIMNGWEFLLNLASFASHHNTFVFIVTSSTDRIDQIKASKHPLVSKFLTKPVFKDTLIALKELAAFKQAGGMDHDNQK